MQISFSPSKPALTTRIVAALMLLSLLCASPRPANADGAASTRNIILGAAAVAAAVIINNNVQHKRLTHDTIVGTTEDGGRVYADGRVVYPNGDVLYTSNGNGRPCQWGQNAYNTCSRAVVYYPRSYHGHDHGKHLGWDKHHDDERYNGNEDHGHHGHDDR